MSNRLINTPEFWERVKREYKPESHPDGYNCLCANSETFKKVWSSEDFRFLMRSELQAHAKDFLSQGHFNGMCLGGIFLFIPKYSTCRPDQMRAVRHAFIEYMLEKTKKDLQDKK